MRAAIILSLVKKLLDRLEKHIIAQQKADFNQTP